MFSEFYVLVRSLNSSDCDKPTVDLADDMALHAPQ